MSPVAFAVLSLLLICYLWIERYFVTPPYFFIYYVLFSIVLSVAVV